MKIKEQGKSRSQKDDSIKNENGVYKLWEWKWGWQKVHLAILPTNGND